MSEKLLMQQIQVEVTKLGGRVFRNNTGVYSGSDGSIVRTGLCVGSADLIGWYPIGVYATFLAIEVKTQKGRIRDEQIKFLDTVNRSGGIGIVARSVEDVKKSLIEAVGRKHKGYL